MMCHRLHAHKIKIKSLHCLQCGVTAGDIGTFTLWQGLPQIVALQLAIVQSQQTMHVPPTEMVPSEWKIWTLPFKWLCRILKVSDWPMLHCLVIHGVEGLQACATVVGLVSCVVNSLVWNE